jgi:hypothetical protein
MRARGSQASSWPPLARPITGQHGTPEREPSWSGVDPLRWPVLARAGVPGRARPPLPALHLRSRMPLRTRERCVRTKANPWRAVSRLRAGTAGLASGPISLLAPDGCPVPLYLPGPAFLAAPVLRCRHWAVRRWFDGRACARGLHLDIRSARRVGLARRKGAQDDHRDEAAQGAGEQIRQEFQRRNR